MNVKVITIDRLSYYRNSPDWFSPGIFASTADRPSRLERKTMLAGSFPQERTEERFPLAVPARTGDAATSSWQDAAGPDLSPNSHPLQNPSGKTGSSERS